MKGVISPLTPLTITLNKIELKALTGLLEADHGKNCHLGDSRTNDLAEKSNVETAKQQK